MKLVPMSPVDYEFWFNRSRQIYVESKMRANGLTESAAEELAWATLKRVLPQGIDTKDNFLLTAKDENDNILGFIWYSIVVEDPTRAYIYDLIVEEEFRGRGYGRQIMQIAEDDMRKRGLKRVSLNVFCFNKTAISLYESLGFETTNQQMEKDLAQS